MIKQKISSLEIILIISGLTIAILGFKLINTVYIKEGQMSWLMLIAIFTWLMLIILFVLLGLIVENSKMDCSITTRIE